MVNQGGAVAEQTENTKRGRNSAELHNNFEILCSSARSHKTRLSGFEPVRRRRICFYKTALLTLDFIQCQQRSTACQKAIALTFP